jgi:hypothetical protein
MAITPDLQDRYIKETEVSNITSIKLQTLRNHRHKGYGIPYYKMGKSVFYRYSDVISFMEQHRIDPGSF